MSTSVRKRLDRATESTRGLHKVVADLHFQNNMLNQEVYRLKEALRKREEELPVLYNPPGTP